MKRLPVNIMIKRQCDIFSVILVAIVFAVFSIFLLFSTERVFSMSETELFENLIKTFTIFRDFHPSVATHLMLFSLTVLWIAWIIYLTSCIIISVRWFKERHNDI